MIKGKLIIGIGAALLIAGGLFFVFGCGGEGGGDAGLPSYGGTDPKGDFIVVMVDRDNQKVKKINFTEGETESSQSWYEYTAVAAESSNGSGFSIVNTIDLGEEAFVLFAEIPDAACVFQAFDSEGSGDGNPVFLVARETPAASSLYSRAYNWVKFFIDPVGTGSDMACGFAAFDESGQAGKMYGASYSKKLDFEDDDSYPDGLSNINSSEYAGIDALTWNAGSGSFVIWDSELGSGDWSGAMAVSGTASGALVLDWGHEAGGGGALAVPQTSAVDNLTTFWPIVTGTYLTMAYGYDSDEETEEIGPVKVVISNEGEDGYLSVYDYDYKTVGGGLLGATVSLTKVEEYDSGPRDEPINESFEDVAGNDDPAILSSVVENAHLCKGAFIAAPVEELVIMIGFDPSGRFFGFTMFEDMGDGLYTVRFGLGIKDANYDDSKAPPLED